MVYKTPPTKKINPLFYVKFSETDCRVCPVKTACTKGKRRAICVHERPLVEILQDKRALQQTEAYKDLYRRRAGVEGTISQATWVLGMRRARYVGQAKTHLQNILTAAAINLTRAINLLNEVPLAETRVSRFKALAA